MTTTPAPEPDDDPEAYIGLDVAEAEDQARARGWTTIRRLEPDQAVTLEYMEGRLNFEVVDGVVTDSRKG